MTDFEITRLAFKAAFSGADLIEDKDMMRHWSPLTDDGDALRLAVKLGLPIVTSQLMDGHFGSEVLYSKRGIIMRERHGDDPYAATRRAIVRAAAEIGKEME